MKQAAALGLAILAAVFLAYPASAKKTRLADDELDITTASGAKGEPAGSFVNPEGPALADAKAPYRKEGAMVLLPPKKDLSPLSSFTFKPFFEQFNSITQQR